MRHLLLALLFTSAASAQTLEQLSSVRIDDQPMSARAAAMGGASDALHPDGSDLASNPALIASLKRPVFSLSGVETTFDVVEYEFEEFDIVPVLAPQTQRSLASVSAAIPWRGAVIGLYTRSEPRLSYGTLFPQQGGLFDFQTCVDCQYAIFAGTPAWDRRERRSGIVAAFERGALSFGAGAELQQLDETFEVLRVPYQAIPLSPMEQLTYRTRGSKIVPKAGVRWRIGSRAAVAAAYEGAASRERTVEACNIDYPFAGCRSTSVLLTTDDVRAADAYRASVTVAPVGAVTLTAEAVRHNYGKSGASNLVGVFGGLEYRDTTDLHAGIEYRVPRMPVSLRAGWQRQPAKFEGIDYLSLHDRTSERLTYGAGFEIAGARVDVAYDDADAPALRRAVVGVTFGMR